jgi:hypothetical protein
MMPLRTVLSVPCMSLNVVLLPTIACPQNSLYQQPFYPYGETIYAAGFPGPSRACSNVVPVSRTSGKPMEMETLNFSSGQHGLTFGLPGEGHVIPDRRALPGLPRTGPSKARDRYDAALRNVRPGEPRERLQRAGSAIVRAGVASACCPS